MRELIEVLEIHLTEGLISAPPKLYAEIKEWIISVVATIRVKEFEKTRGEVLVRTKLARAAKHAVPREAAEKEVKHYDDEIAGWKSLIKRHVKVDVYSESASESFALSLKDWPNLSARMKSEFKDKNRITVHLRDMPAGVGGSFRRGDAWSIHLATPRWAWHDKVKKQFENSTGRTLRHEMIHMVQEVMSKTLSAKDKMIGGLPQRQARPGMPSKKLMNPDMTQALPRINRNDAEFTSRVHNLKADLKHRGISDADLHDLDDVEFYTALSDAVGDLREVPMDGLNRAEKNKVIAIFTGAIPIPKITHAMTAWRKFDPRRKVYPLVQPDGPRTAGHDPSVLKPNVTLMNWKRNARGKWKKAVKEPTKAIS